MPQDLITQLPRLDALFDQYMLLIMPVPYYMNMIVERIQKHVENSQNIIIISNQADIQDRRDLGSTVVFCCDRGGHDWYQSPTTELITHILIYLRTCASTEKSVRENSNFEQFYANCQHLCKTGNWSS